MVMLVEGTLMDVKVNRPQSVRALSRSWQVLVLTTVLAAAAAGGVSLLQPLPYTAVASLPLHLDQFAPHRVPYNPGLYATRIDIAARRSRLIALAQSPAIEAQVPPDVVARVAPNRYQPGRLLADGALRVAPVGDRLDFHATATTAATATALANAWATAYRAYVWSYYPDEPAAVQLARSATVSYDAAIRTLGRQMAIGGGAGLLVGLLLALGRTFVPQPQER